jgi:hypothetical protein
MKAIELFPISLGEKQAIKNDDFKHRLIPQLVTENMQIKFYNVLLNFLEIWNGNANTGRYRENQM